MGPWTTIGPASSPASSIAPLPESLLARLGPARRLLLAQVAEAAQAQDRRVALVGGAIVDLLENRPVKDLDLVVEGHAPGLARVLADRHGGGVLVHRAFQTATWTTVTGEAVDLITARQETYAGPAALPEVTPGTLEQDLTRRDFTVLCMALDLTSEALLDPTGGQQDLEARRLRVQHPDSFVDDPTRVWRAARWGARLDLSPTPETVDAMARARALGAHEALGIERLGQEVHRCLADGRARALFTSLESWGWLRDLHPLLPDDTPSVLAHAQDHVWRAHHQRGGEPYPLADAGWLALAGLIPPGDRARLRRLVPGGGPRWTLWTEGPAPIQATLAACTGAPTRATFGREVQDLVPAVRGALADKLPPPWLPLADWWETTGRHVRSAVDGHALLAAGVSPGPGVGRGLQAAREAAWEGASAAAQLEAARSNAEPRHR